MAKVTVLLVVSVTIGTVATLFYHFLVAPHPVPTVEDAFWGPQNIQPLHEDTKVYPFTINVSENVLNDLNQRLERELDSYAIRVPPALEGVGFEYGFHSKFLQHIGNYWLKEYDWKKREALLNRYPHFKTSVAGLNIHFQRVQVNDDNDEGKEKRAILILHGWPGSFVEFQKLIPLLQNPGASKYSFELVIPSLPGYGFSATPARRGMSCTEIANVFRRLMNRLGHEKFFVMGGDLGAIVATDMAVLYPKSVIAMHCNLCHTTTVMTAVKYLLATNLPYLFRTTRDNNQPKIRPALEMLSFFLRESGYFHMQATKPDTIGVGLENSPLGLAAYILEKFATATNRDFIQREDGGLLEKFSLDELLDNVMIYWVTQSSTTAARLYSELLDPRKRYQLDRVPTNVPVSCQYLPEEIFILPEYVLQDKYYNLQNYTVEAKGGHFGAMEEPQLIAENALALFNNY